MRRSKPRLTKPHRLDAELVRRGLAASRAEARAAIEAGRVEVGGVPARRAATLVAVGAPVAMRGPARRFVSRGGEKLDGALERFDVTVADRKWLDAGSSTGGFTDRLLHGGALQVVALDVGYGQLDYRLRTHHAVVVMERTNVRHLTVSDLPFRPQGIVADLSFISLTAVMPALQRVAESDADWVLLIKPQFEAGKGAVGKGGVVRSPEVWRGALENVVTAARAQGLGLVDAALAHPAGPAGNREFFVHLKRGPEASSDALDRVVGEARR